MKVHVLFAQRKERYAGEYGLEALAVMTEHDYDGNPDYLGEQFEQHQATKEFTALAIVDLEVDEAAIRKILQPSGAVPAKVVGGSQAQ